MTIREIAELAGVSKATVSYVLNGTKNITPEVKQRVLRVVAESGYKKNRIATSLRKSSTSTIGVVVEDIISFPVAPIIHGISERAEAEGYQIILSDLRILDKLYNNYHQTPQYRKKMNDAVDYLLQAARVDAVIFVGMYDRDFTGLIDKIGKPLVFAYCTTRDPADYCVSYDGHDVSGEVIHSLARQGHERIGVITGLPGSGPSEARLRGALSAAHEAGLAVGPDCIQPGDWEYPSGYAGAQRLLRLENPPTAIFAMNDLMAAGAMDAVKDAGLSVPGDVSVIGFDDRELASFVRPNLSTVRIDLVGIGRAAAETAIARIRGEEAQHLQVLRSVMIPRDSVAERK